MFCSNGSFQNKLSQTLKKNMIRKMTPNVPILLFGKIEPQLWNGLPTKTAEIGPITLNKHILPEVIKKGVRVISICDQGTLDTTSKFLSILEKRWGKELLIMSWMAPFDLNHGPSDINWSLYEILAVEPVTVVEGVPNSISSFHYKVTFLDVDARANASWFAGLGFC